MEFAPRADHHARLNESQHTPRPSDVPIPPLSLYPNQSFSLAGISLRSFILGTTFTAGLLGTTLLAPSSPLWRIPFFLAALSLFHFLEFYTTALKNTNQATTAAFLLTSNWPAYPIAHTAACVECILRRTWLPYTLPLRLDGLALCVGIVLVVAGQTVRSLAMLHAATSFNHTVQMRKADSHRLVTTGVYGLVRHPSYFGFLYWGLGTQLVLGNVVCFVGYAVVLCHFFGDRIRGEEKKLVEFFGHEYLAYRRRVGTMMPFVG